MKVLQLTLNSFRAICTNSLRSQRSQILATRWNSTLTSENDNNKTNESTEKISNNSEINEVEKKLIEENQQLLEKVKFIDDKYKRSLADQENLRQRMGRQIEEAKVFGIQSFSKDLLEVADILGMAIQSVPKEEIKKTDNEVLKSLFEGVSMTEKQLQTVFRRHGIIQINPIGEMFDPNEHHALFESQDPSKEAGTVSVVTKVGYKLKERTIRPAMVGVVKAP